MVKLIIDSDGVSDDVRAITLALNHPEAEVIAITSVQGCVTVKQATANIKRTVRASNKEIPVYQGAGKSLINLSKDNNVSDFFGLDGIGDKPEVEPRVLESDFVPTSDEHAAIALIRLSKQNPDAVVVCLGPLTNLAMALRFDPNFARFPKKLVIMGGNYYGIGNVEMDDRVSSAEFNFHGDPEAAYVVLKEMSCPIVVLPWEANFFATVENENAINFHAHLDYPTELGAYLRAATSMGVEKMGALGRQYAYCDEIALAAAIDEEKIVLDSQYLSATVELNGFHTRGQVVVNWNEIFYSNEKEKLKQASGKIKFIKKYDVQVLDRWMHQIVSGHGIN